jgi:hypothetical protein
MTEAENWKAVTTTSQDGTPIEAYQFTDPPEEQREREAQAARANANLQRMTIRRRIQTALLEPDQSTSALLQEAVEWAKAQPFPFSRRTVSRTVHDLAHHEVNRSSTTSPICGQLTVTRVDLSSKESTGVEGG